MTVFVFTGSKFDVRVFHSVVLESGIVPLSVLDGLVTDWINSVDLTEPSTETCAVPDAVFLKLGLMLAALVCIWAL